MSYNESVQSVASKVQSDVALRNRTIRVIDGPYGHINDDEYRFCMRVGSHPGYLPDYHFWLQTSTGEWCDKAGWFNAATSKDDVNPTNEIWNMGTYYNFYDSDTIYFAITE